jgi:excisionase family DNA binding protein
VKRQPCNPRAIDAARTLAIVPDVDLMSDGLATFAEACEFLRCKKSRLYALLESGLPYVQEGGRRLIPRRALHQFAAAGLVRRDRAVAS